MIQRSDRIWADPSGLGSRDAYPAGYVDPMHSHDHVQILHGSAGLMSVRTLQANFLLSPKRALWLPAGTRHEVSCRSQVSLQIVYLPQAADARPRMCRAFEVSDPLNALIQEAADLPRSCGGGDREARIVALMIDEIDRSPDAACAISMPSDPRLTRICEAILLDPGDPRDLDAWASLAAMSRRTLTRRFRQETGISLAAWQRQIRLIKASTMVATGSSITQASLEVGYGSPTAFTAMFTRTLGASPRRSLR